MYVYGLCLLFDFATKNLHLETIFYHLVAKWRLNNFFNFEPCGEPSGIYSSASCAARPSPSGNDPSFNTGPSQSMESSSQAFLDLF